jgi:hypothetical protein
LIAMAIGRFPTGYSYWPFQLHYASAGMPGVTEPTAGMGDTSGLTPGRPELWTTSTHYALDHAKKYGWGAWYGAARAGIHGFEGIRRYARGGPIPEPTLLVGKTLGPYAMAGEVAPEWVTPQTPTPSMTRSHVEMPIYIGNREVERLWVDGYNLVTKRGRAFSLGAGRAS